MSRQVVEVDRMFGSRLKELREQRGLSLRRLGTLIHCSHGYLWELEAGTKRPSSAVVALLDTQLGADGGLSAMVREVSADSGEHCREPEANGQLASGGLEFAATWQQGMGAAVDLWRGDMQRRGFLRQAGYSAAAFLPPVMRWLVSPLDEKPIGCGERLVGQPDVTRIRRLTATYRSLDNEYGGGSIRGSVVRFLDGEVAPLLAGRYDADTGRSLWTSAAEATQLAAWASYVSVSPLTAGSVNPEQPQPATQLSVAYR